MSQKLQHKILLLLIIFISPAPCLSDEMAIFCHTELGYDSRYTWREVVLPEGGLYKMGLSLIEDLPPAEMDVLRWLNSRYSAPALDPPLIQVSEQKDDKGNKHVQAICVASGEGQPVIPYCAIWVFDDDFFAELSKLPQLHHLDLFAFEIDNKIFPKVSHLPNLEYLGLPCQTKDEHLKHIAGLSKLKFVNVSGTQIKGRSLSVLAEIPKLRILDLRRTKLDSGALAGLKSCKSLETLLLSDTNIRDDDLKALTDLKMLKYITLHKTGITDNGLKILSQLKNLKYVSLYDTSTTKAGREELSQTLSGLSVDLDLPQQSDEFLKERQYVHACLGNKWAQYIVADSRGTDRIESLKWYLVLEARKDEKAKKQLSMWNVIHAIERLKQGLNEKQIAEAEKRAKAYMYSYKRGAFKIKFELDRKQGLPLYQYAFEW